MSDEAPVSTQPEAPKPVVSKKLATLIVAVLGALIAYLTQSCTPAQVDKADRAFERAQAELACVRDVERAYGDLVLQPEEATAGRAKEAFAALKACAKGEAPAEADAGSK